MGLSILLHAIGMVIRNSAAALRISGLLMGALFVLTVLLGVEFLFMGTDTSDMILAGDYPYGRTALVMGFQALATLWIAVAWHRFILNEEQPGAVMPGFNAAAILSYLWAGVIFAVVLAIVAIPIILVSALLVAPLIASPSAGAALLGGLILFLLLWLPITYMSYRISPILPSAALQARLPLKEAWYATGTSGSAFVTLALASVLAVWALNLPGIVLAQVSGFLGFVWAFAVQWAVLLVGISVLTTIYGHYVEKRALDA